MINLMMKHIHIEMLKKMKEEMRNELAKALNDDRLDISIKKRIENGMNERIAALDFAIAYMATFTGSLN